jgi:hypothetical protein
MTELLPCPFCGGEASYEYSYDDYNHDCIVCHNDECGASLTCWPYEGEKVTAAWNRRADTVPVVRGEWKRGREFSSYPRVPFIGDAYYCSNCEEEAYYGQQLFGFCPNCGAKMESEGST